MRRVLTALAAVVVLAGGSAAWARPPKAPPAAPVSAEAERYFQMSRDEAEPEEQFILMRMAADRGHPRANWETGMMLLQGYGVAASEQKAASYVLRAAQADDIHGLSSWGVMLALGQGVEEDDAEARVWYGKAAERGSSHALQGLGFMLLTGEGGPVDYERGVAYLELAKEGGDKNAGRILREVADRPDADQRKRIDKLKKVWKREHGDPRTFE